MMNLGVSILPQGVLGWSLLIIIFVFIVLFVTVLNPRTRKNNNEAYGDLLDKDKPDAFRMIMNQVSEQARVFKDRNDNSAVFQKLNPETNEGFVVRVLHDAEVVQEIERTTYFIHDKEVSREDLNESKEKLDEAVDRGIDAFNDIVSFDSDTFSKDNEIIGTTNVVQKIHDETGETVLFTDSKLGFKAVENKLVHEGYERV